MTIAATPPRAIPAPTASLAPRTASVAPPVASVTGTAASVTPEAASAKRSHTTLRAMMWLALIGGAILAGIGFTGSYNALQTLGQDHGLGWFSHAFPIGVDAGIVVLLALDMLLAWKRTPWPMLRLLAHLFTAATIVFNAASSPGPIAADPIGAGLHGIIPIMFVASVEAARRMIRKIAALEDGTESAGIPVARWFLAPIATPLLWRRMKLWDVPTYGEAVIREQSLKVYRVLLEDLVLARAVLADEVPGQLVHAVRQLRDGHGVAGAGRECDGAGTGRAARDRRLGLDGPGDLLDRVEVERVEVEVADLGLVALVGEGRAHLVDLDVSVVTGGGDGGGRTADDGCRGGENRPGGGSTGQE
ncbi:DUF2637 domain-containing protein [Streptomyces prunicolor]|uniref:DUF2637 domain-containing protein n=1 Tax=Streptomyces prunicolor TaxID=67348 RepID=UPI0033E62835